MLLVYICDLTLVIQTDSGRIQNCLNPAFHKRRACEMYSSANSNSGEFATTLAMVTNAIEAEGARENKGLCRLFLEDAQPCLHGRLSLLGLL
jgi:hypothetical protein